MAVITKLQTNATASEVEEAVSCYRGVVEDKETYLDVYMSTPDVLNLSAMEANDTLYQNLLDIYDKKSRQLHYQIIETQQV